MLKTSKAFATGAHKEVAKWNCVEMFPKPKPQAPVDWIGGVTKAAKTGLAIYKELKEFIPKKDEKKPEELELSEDDGSNTEAYKKRLVIWNKALDQCKADKAAFQAKVDETA